MKKSNRKFFFRFVKSILRIFVRKPKIILLGEELTEPAIYLCNHVGAKGPLNLELYFPKQFRFWGTFEMNETIGKRFKYLATTYFQDKKHLNKFLAYVIAVIAVLPMTGFYKGMQLISTFPDNRLIKTIKTSLNEIENKKSIIIFPENSSNGYFDELIEYHPGFTLLAKQCYGKGIDLPIYNMYYKKKAKQLIVSKPIRYSELMHLEKEQIAEMFLNDANKMGKTIYGEVK